MEISKISKLISCVLAMCLCFAVTPVFAQQQYVSPNASASTNTYLNIDDGDVVVSVPTTVIVDGEADESNNNTGDYSVYAQGDVAGDSVLNVYPKTNTVVLQQTGKPDVSALINQQQTAFFSSELMSGATTTGSVTAQGLLAGSYQGEFSFVISMINRYSYYSSIELAVNDANALTTENADVARENFYDAEAALYIEDDTTYLYVLDDCEDVAALSLNNDTELNLNGYTVDFADGAYLTANADLSMFNGVMNGNNAGYIINDRSSVSSLLLSRTELNLVSSGDMNTFAVYTNAVENTILNSKITSQNDTANTVGCLIISGSSDFDNRIENCEFSAVNEGGPIRAIWTKGATTISGGEYTGKSSSGSSIFIYDSGNLIITDDAVVDCTSESGALYAVGANGTSENQLDIIDADIKAEAQSGVVCGLVLGSNTANINGVNINVVTHDRSATAVGISTTTGASADINLYKGTVKCDSDYDNVGTGITCGSGSHIDVLSGNTDDVYVYGTTWGLSVHGTANVNGGTYVSVAHPMYLSGGSNIVVENAKIYDVSSKNNSDNVNGPVYIGGSNMSSDAVITFRNCVFGDPNITSPIHKFCMVSTTLSGYQDPAEVNIYDCDFYSGYYSVFSYNGPGINQTKFNIYGDTHFYKSYDSDSGSWTEYNQDEIKGLLSDWKTTLYANRSVGNHFVMSYGNGTVEDGVVISVPLEDDANIYDYR